MSVHKTGDLGFERIEKELKYLNSHQVVIGFFGDRDSKLLTIVRANEYGAHIVPKKGQYLWVPSENNKDGEHPEGLFIPKGKRVACKREEDGSLTVYFYLLKEVDIPSRPFIRKAFEKNRKKYISIVKEGIEDIIYEKGTGKQVLEQLGIAAQADIRKSAVDWRVPGNAPLTVALKNKHSNDPLVDTGELQRKVTWKIMKSGDDD